MRALLLACGVTAALVATPATLAQPGALDPTFGDGGVVTTDIGGGEYGNALAVQPDGRIVLAGNRTGIDTEFDLLLVRYLPDGTLDPDFGDGGVVTTDLGDDERALAVALQPDGKILVAGAWAFGENRSRFLLARYLPDGALDPDFGNGGVVVTDTPGSREVAQGVMVLPDGRILIGGYSPFPAFGAARYLSDGTLDPTFGGGDGIQQVTSVNLYSGYEMALQPDGKLVVAGTGHFLNTLADVTLLRLLSDGALDPTFGSGDGVVVYTFAFGQTTTALALRPDGRIFVTAHDGYYWQMLQYLPDGALDLDFGGGDGAVQMNRFGEARDLAVLPDGNVLVGGVAGSYLTYDFLLARFTAQGALDPTFGDGGLTVTDLGGGDTATSMALLDDGRVLLGGRSDAGGTFDLILTRHLGEGGAGCSLAFHGDVSAIVNGAGTAISFAGRVVNSGTGSKSARLRVSYSRIGGGPAGALNYGPVNLAPTGGNGVPFSLTQPIPGAAPPGSYDLTFELIDAASGTACATDDATITLLAPRVSGGGAEWVAAPLAFAESAAASQAVVPNPFVGQARINFLVAAPARVRLSVHDVLGREVAALVDGDLGAGSYSATFDGRGLAAGTYVYRLVVGSEVRTGRMTRSR